MEKETTLNTDHRKRPGQIKMSVGFIKPQRRIVVALTITNECSVCGTIYNPEEHEGCPRCADNEFDPYNIFHDVFEDNNVN